MPYKERAKFLAYQRAYNLVRDAKPERRFVGVDGEGGDRDGVHTYSLLTVGERHVYDPKGLTLSQCLHLIWSYGSDFPDSLLASFFFDYDVTMMFKNESPERVNRLLSRKPELPWNFVGFHGFEVDYIPHKRFAVKRDGKTVVVHDVSGFFQCSFAKALERWDIGGARDKRLIEEGKARRAGFSSELNREDIDYNKLEIRLLGELMTEFRSTCQAIDVNVRSWEGAGCLASAMLRDHATTTNTKLAGTRLLQAYARQAYYGGRFEISRAGEISDVREIDIASAYPSVMSRLPCMEHTKWVHAKGAPTQRLYVARIRYECPPSNLWGPFPCRRKDGSIFFPLKGEGWYWSPEINAAKALNTRIEFLSHWEAIPHCDCAMFPWVEAMYRERLAMGKNAKGIVLKLGLNSLYGKFAQSIGSPRYANPVWAGLITSMTRAKLLRVFECHEQSDVVMFATDAVYLTSEPNFYTSKTKELGEYEYAEPTNLFICKPGFYFTDDATKLKTRGISQRYLERHVGDFRHVWARDGYDGVVPIPGVSMFIGARQALRLRKGDAPQEFYLQTGIEQNDWQAGTWITRTVNMTFNPYTKRIVEDKHGLTKPYPDSFLTIPYKKGMGFSDAIVYEHPDNDELLFGMAIPD